MNVPGRRPRRDPVLAGLTFLAGLAAFASTASAAARPAVVSARPTMPMRIDGRSDEWAAAARIVDPKSGAVLAFLNDGRYLYILVTVDGPKPRESLASTGLTVRARPQTAKTWRGALFLERSVPAETLIRWREGQGEVLSDTDRAKLRETPRHDLCLTYAVGPTGSVFGPLRRLPDRDPAVFAISAGDSGTTYELRMPLPPPDLAPGGIGAAPGEAVRVSFEWGGAARKIASVRATREIPPSERGENSPSGQTWAQEYLNAFDPLSPPSMGTKKFTFTAEVKLAEAR